MFYYQIMFCFADITCRTRNSSEVGFDYAPKLIGSKVELTIADGEGRLAFMQVLQAVTCNLCTISNCASKSLGQEAITIEAGRIVLHTGLSNSEVNIISD
jgi:hypothetical protein